MISKILLNDRFSIIHTTTKYINYILSNYLNHLKNTHPIYNIIKVSKLLILTDDNQNFTTDIFEELLKDDKIITNFLISSKNKKFDDIIVKNIKVFN